MLQRSADRVAMRVERLGPDDDEESVELMEAQNATEDQLLVNVSECVASLMRASAEAFIPTFALMLPEIIGSFACPLTIFGQIRRVKAY